jgi:hypothetical protein
MREFKEKNLRADIDALKAKKEIEELLNKKADAKMKMDKQAEVETK